MTGFILNDINSNNTVCQEDCYLADYDKDNQRAKCSCKAKESVLSFIDMKINTSELYQQFTDIDNIINIKIIFCYKELFCKEGIINNIIFFLILPFILLHIIVIIIFYCNQKKKLDKKIHIFMLTNLNLSKIYRIFEKIYRIFKKIYRTTLSKNKKVLVLFCLYVNFLTNLLVC